MLINISKNVVQSIEIKVPAFYKDAFGIDYSMINDKGVLIRVFKKSITATFPGDDYYEMNISSAIKGTQITELEFMHRFEETEKIINQEIGVAV